MPTHADASAAIATLVGLDTPRVWSMLVSIFGDLAFQPEDRIEGPLLTRLTDGMDIKPEAVRVALHRLRNDGWIDSKKVGRTAQHALTASALRARNDAAPLIYHRLSEMPQRWNLALTAQGDVRQRDGLMAAGFVPVTARVYVAHAECEASADAVLCAGTRAPDWLRDELVPGDLTAQFDRLLTALHSVRQRLGTVNGHALPLTETALLRCLIVHQWRRLVLRHPYLPPALLGADWPGHQCRALVCDLLHALPRPSLDALATEDRRAVS